MSKERLEEIKKSLSNFYNAMNIEDDFKDYIFNDLKVEWLIEQAERVEFLEESLKHQTEHFKISNELIEQQNKRYQRILTLLNDKEKLATEIYKENENLVMFTPGQVIDYILEKIEKLERESE